MSTSNKIILACASLCLVAIVAVVAVVAVYSATNQTVSSQISVSYTVKDIAGSVTASYQIGEAGGSGSMGTVKFNPEDTNKEGLALEEGKVDLTAQNDFVKFDYYFTNDLDKSTNLSYIITLVYTDEDTDDENVELYYSFNKYLENSEVDYTLSNNLSGAIGESLPVAPGSSAHVYIKIKVAENIKSAKFNGEFKWTLTAAPQE